MEGMLLSCTISGFDGLLDGLSNYFCPSNSTST